METTNNGKLLKTSCLMLEINEFRCYEAKIEESEKKVKKAGSRQESNPGHLWLAVYIEDCEGWWSSGCCGSVAEHWWLIIMENWVEFGTRLVGSRLLPFLMCFVTLISYLFLHIELLFSSLHTSLSTLTLSHPHRMDHRDE